MFSSLRSLGVSGVGGYGVSLETFLASGLPHFDVVGLPDAAVNEARERVRAAIKNNGFRFPSGRITVNLGPADKKKAGTHYDLPMLLGILAASHEIETPPRDSAFVGELALNGDLRPISGALPMAIAAEREGIRHLYVPAENASEAAFARGVNVYPVDSAAQLIRHLRGERSIAPAVEPALDPEDLVLPDFADVKGQESVKRAFEVAAAGGHNILLVGPPGAGKSMMAKRLPGILPDMTREEMIESTEIYSVSGLTSRRHPIISTRPFRSPHHTVSPTALSGGGTIPKPGEISLAHNGVLFLDEMPEFPNSALEILRQPLEDGQVTVSRVAGTVTYPSQFMLVCAMNPCKCGWYGHPSGRCRCTEQEVRRYHSRISGPLLDRIDIIVEVPALNYEELQRKTPAEPSSAIRERVNAARERQQKRFGSYNARMGPKELREYCPLGSDAEELMRAAFQALDLSARSYDRILRVARTIADLDGSANILPQHLAEAVQFRAYDFRQS